MSARTTAEQTAVAAEGSSSARVTAEQTAAAVEGSSNARVTTEQSTVAVEGSSSARTTTEQAVAAVEGAARIRTTAVYVEIMGTGTARASNALAEFMAVVPRYFATTVVAEAIFAPPFRVTTGLLEFAVGPGGRLVSTAAAEIIVWHPWRTSTAILEIMADPFGRRVTTAGAEILGEPFGHKVTMATMEVLATRSWEPDVIVYLPSGYPLSLNRAEIPLPRVVYRAAREWEEPPGPRMKVGHPRLFLEWDFAKPEWLVLLFGGEWVSGRIWTVRRRIEAINPPVWRASGRNVIISADVLVWRPDFHREPEWDMGVWRELRIECVVLSMVYSEA